MRKLLLVIMIFAIATTLFAGGIENKSNFSVGYLMNMSRNTETQRPDAVFYNPAGTAFLKDGLYVDIGNQFVFKDYVHDVTNLNNSGAAPGFGVYNADNITYLYPNAAIVFSKNDFAVFGAFGVFAGGGTLKYEGGTYLTYGMLNPYKQLLGATDADIANSLEVYSVTFGQIFGASYAFREKISVAAAIRFLQASQTLDATLDNAPTGSWATGFPGQLPSISSRSLLKTEASANGIGGIFGVHFKPIEELDIAATYQTITKMEYTFDKVEGSLAPLVAGMGYVKDGKFDRDLPAALGLGIGYRIIEELYASLSFNYYFNKQSSDTYASYNDSWEIAAGANYDFSDKISFSLGALYSKQGATRTENSAESPHLDSFSIGAGTSISPIKDLTIDIAVFKPFYFGTEFETTLATTNIAMDLEKKSMVLIGIGATYRFF